MDAQNTQRINKSHITLPKKLKVNLKIGIFGVVSAKIALTRIRGVHVWVDARMEK